MYKSDVKIFELMQFLKSLGKIQFDKDFCTAIGMPKQSIARIKQGKAHFTAEHIENICRKYGVNANWIFSIDNQIFTKIKSTQKSVQNTKL
jgi:transcriptional regulator with XRE-family HTH domain